jgi:hypothetical protein
LELTPLAPGQKLGHGEIRNNGSRLMSAHWETFEECREVAEGLRSLDWATLSQEERRRSGLVAKWALQKGFEVAHQALGRPLPEDRSLQSLCRSAGGGLNSEQIALLGWIDLEVTAAESNPSDPLVIHEQACSFACGLLSCIDQSIILSRVATGGKVQSA